MLTDNGIQFTHRKQDRQAFEHLFDRVCRQYAIEHRLTQVAYSVTSAPEPETYAMQPAGLGVIDALTRRRTRR